jgi:universal stress protein E
MQTLKNILYFADGEFVPTRAFRRAVALAEQHQAKLTLMDVTVESDITAELVKRFGLADDVQQSEQRLAALTQLAETWVGGQRPQLRVLIGTPFIEVILAVLRNGHDLVLKPARPRPGCHGLFASTEMHLLRKCPCPVWIDREPRTPDAADAPPRCRGVLAAVDAAQPEAAELNRSILDTAAAVAAQDGAALDLVHVWQAPFEGRRHNDGQRTPNGPQDAKLADAARAIERQHADALETLAADYRGRMADGGLHLLHGNPAEQLLAQAQALASDLIVLGTLSRPREPGLFIGSTAEDLLQDAQTSVLALKPAGFVSPVQ